MSDLYHTLDDVLAQKIELYNELIEVMKEEWTSISEYSRENLEKALEKKSSLLAKVHEVNHKREEIVQTFAQNLGRTQSEVTLKTIIGLKDNPWGKRMHAYREKIREQIKTINEMNSENKLLINRSSLAMKKSISWLYEVDTKYTPYYSNGQLSEPTMGSRVVNTDV
jgi:flagellar biosynthesis/type III secretory pathway chaperone